MQIPPVAVVLSGAGGVTKTTTSVSLAMCSASAGHKTLLVDLDPRGAATEWAGTGVEFTGGIADLMGHRDPERIIEDLVQVSDWNENLSILAGDRRLELKEKNPVDDAELSLATALDSSDWDRVVIDCPNRSGGVLLRSALIPASAVVYAADPTKDGYSGVVSAKESVDSFLRGQKLRGIEHTLSRPGVIVSKYHTGAVEWELEGRNVEKLKELVGVCALLPFQPFVQKSREAGVWFGDYRKGQQIKELYAETTERIFS